MKKYILVILLSATSVLSLSNNITISNTSLVGKNTTDNYILIQFDLAWDNSWRTSSGPSNWDAAWVFVKYRIKGQTDWHHASLNWVDGTGTGDGHTVPTGAVIKGDIDTGDGNSSGVFIYSDIDKAQSAANYPGVQLRWQYGEDGVLDSDLVEICVFGIEMVYVPDGSFELGKLNEFWLAFYTYPTTTASYAVTGEGAIDVKNSDGHLYYSGAGDQSGPIPAAFPKGYRAFYCMKYEITQEQYVEFLLKLNSTQSSARAYTLGGNRNGISGGFGTYTTSNPYVACNYLSWGDLTAYMDWAGLRPMTEMEYEKSCRGILVPVFAEFAWGSSDATVDAYTLSNPGTETELISANYNIAVGNLSYSNTDGAIDGPLRVGIFAAHQNNSNRVTAGSTYYGIMEMSGNVFEQVVTVGNSVGRTFTHTHGDGTLDGNGNANVPNWPWIDAVGAGVRGGSWKIGTGGPGHTLAMASRTLAVSGASARLDDRGGRGVRTAP